MRKKNLFLPGMLLLLSLIGCGKEQEDQADYLSTVPLKDLSGQEETGEVPEDPAAGEEGAGELPGQGSGAEQTGQENGDDSAQAPSSDQPDTGSSEGKDSPSSESAAQDSESSAAGEQPDAGFDLKDLAGRVFSFSSGAGGWSTELRIDSDGSFVGNYHDSEMGSIGEEYPNGIMYYCSFNGRFDGLEKVDDFTWQMKLVSLNYDDEPGKEEIQDGTRWIASTAYGVEDGELFYLYLPGAPLAELPEEYLQWVGYFNLENVPETELPYYGLYNVSEQEGFSSLEYEEQSLSERAEAVVSAAETRAGELGAKLDGALSQLDINETSQELFQTWDDALNTLWKLLESELDSERMASLRAEEREWISLRDEQVKEAGLEYEGGTAQPMAEALKAAELTQERAAVLAGYAGYQK